MRNLILIALLLFVFVSVDAQTSKKEQRKAKRAAKEAAKIEEVKTLLESKDYVFEARQALPTGGRSVTLDGSFDIRIEGDEIICYMPYFGRAYSADYGSSTGPFDFEATIKDYKMETTKQGYRVEFEVQKKNNDILSFIFEIGKTGNSSLVINSTNRQSISYYGDVSKEEEEEK